MSCNIKYLLIVFLSCITIENTDGMTVKQLQAAVKLVKSVCQPKAKATTEDIDKMHRGDWAIDHTAMCYVYCAFNMYKLLDNDNKLDYDSTVNQLKTLPDLYKEPTRKCVDDCRDAAVTLSDNCVAAYELAKCLYFCSPETYFLP